MLVTLIQYQREGTIFDFMFCWSGARLTCSTLWIASLKPPCCKPCPSNTHVTKESLRSRLTAEKWSHI